MSTVGLTEEIELQFTSEPTFDLDYFHKSLAWMIAQALPVFDIKFTFTFFSFLRRICLSGTVHDKCQDYCIVFLVFKLQADGSIEVPVPEVFDWLTRHVQVGAHYKKMTTPSKGAMRQSRSPVFFKFVRVDYDKDQGRLNVSKGEFAGHEVINKSGERDTGEKQENSPEYVESIVGSEEEESDSAGKEIGQLYIIYDNVYPVEHLESVLEMLDLCHFKLPGTKSF